MKMFFYVGEKPIDNNHAGNKARVDADKVFEGRHFTSFINLHAREFKSFFDKLS